jgi:hypothetical protein
MTGSRSVNSAAIVRAASGGTWWRRVRPGLTTSCLPQFAQVVGGLPGAVIAFGLPGEGVHLGGQIGDREAAGRDRQQDGGQDGADARLVTSTAPTLVAPIAHTAGERRRFRSSILPLCCRRSPKVTGVPPLLSLHGLPGQDCVPALQEFFGSKAGFSASVITRLTTT